jgi:hypothetical protein
MLFGIDPDTKVAPAMRIRRLAKLLMAEGIVPETLVKSKWRTWRLVERFTTELGSCPARSALSLSINGRS